MVTKYHNEVSDSYGMFHSGVELYGREWSYGMTMDNFSTGVYSHGPCKNSDHTFRETISMGYTTFSQAEVFALIDELKEEWKGCKYHVLSRNCHSFSDAFCRRLGVGALPSWVNQIAGTGKQTVDFFDRTQSSCYGGPFSIFGFFDKVKRGVLGDTSTTEPRPPTSEGDNGKAMTASEKEVRWKEDDAKAGGAKQGEAAADGHDPFAVLKRSPR